MTKVDCLVFGPHPDDVELFCGGLLAKVKNQGYLTGVVDITQGELSTNGDIETRAQEARAAKDILRLDLRQNLKIPDGQIDDNTKNRLKIIKIIRETRPDICLLPYWIDRHPDHEAAAILLRKSIFNAGLKKIDTGQEIYRPKTVLYYMLHRIFEPSFVVDISDEMELKMEAIFAYKSQFSCDAKLNEKTYINNPDFLESIRSRAAYFGSQIGAMFGEGYYYQGMIKIDNILHFFA